MKTNPFMEAAPLWFALPGSIASLVIGFMGAWLFG